MDLSKLPLAEIRRRCDELRRDTERNHWIRTLRADRRRGAHHIAAVLERRMAADRVESRRLAALFARQRRLHEGGALRVAGVDEVGVGPLAGPVVAAAVVLPDDVELLGLDDSKRVTRIARERLAAQIRDAALDVSVAEVPPDEVDALNVYQASLEAMRRALSGLAVGVHHVLVDARTVPGIDVPQTAIVAGDRSEACIAAASIVAKVHRDALMGDLERRHPGYGFARHKGYGTVEHLDALKRLGPSAAHRLSFAPVAASRSD